jgi:hypothetical protein
MSEEESSWDPNRELDGTKGKFKGMAFGVSMRQGSKPYMEIVTVMQQVPGHENFVVRALCSDHCM